MVNQEPMFPILNDPIIKCIPWAAIAQHEKQAQRNHSQTLRRLADRGGLSIHEAYHVIRGQEWPRGFKRSQVNDALYRQALMKLLYEFEKARSEAASRPIGDNPDCF
ncbi:hypothetical protein [Shinella zoogloeoides]|uniref:hypothetical protein n=1 Tax=Shinella zoogloeoides TaxID=352475 RepID=UPI00299D6CBD|nr:hypothetical protein [Shinella zoogloeoides]WPE19841.1 hypothetical protein ShzoTeo12_10170 [Shinella zoogloeoides]